MAPQAAQATQNAETGTKPTEAQLASQRNWLWYVEQLEKGEATDPSGQYVRKTAVQPEGAKRPKYDATDLSRDWGYQAYTAFRQPGTPTQPPCVDCLTPLPPVSGGSGGGSGGGGWSNSCGCFTNATSVPGGGPATTFVSSVGQGGSGYVRDLKITLSAQSISHQVAVTNGGYIRLTTDLNSGAGGIYLYFAFTREVARVLSGLEYTRNRPYSSPTDNLTGFMTKTGRTATASLSFFDIWVPNQDFNYNWATMDLNRGAGGEYIYSYQSKTPNVQNTSNVSEVGVLSGNSSTIQPPAGWTKYQNDLNEGAGGNYVYLCYR